ncbi:response regulator [Paucibacter sp. DJ1R-11]|uniref:response regulator n=1 Tax=Paucibacter sp. DJ1R-11 TaxID=2893556 RepID=UPI0021E420EA|nr:response regulator [Paucibacter sp. DJ1R-11]MCV2365793.1 response regulator [Paucibacter sp. DJ1R-11]
MEQTAKALLPPQRVLVVEDDRKIAQLLLDYLRADGFAADSLADGEQALAAIRQDPPDALVLDLMLPGLDGLSLCRAVREFSAMPILMLTARVSEQDRLQGLDGGADDYICKPFSPRELVARVRAQLRAQERRRPAAAAAAPVLWQVDEGAQRIAWGGQWLALTPLEFRMLRLLLSRPGRVFSRAQLLDTVHSELRDVSDRAIDSHVKNLRRKIAAAQPGCECIASVYGVGYRFDPPT